MAEQAVTRIRFLGVAGYEIVARDGTRILVDPFISENPGAPVAYDSFEKVDLIIVSHAAYDHLGDTEALMRRYGCPVICGGEVKAYLVAKGIGPEQIRATTWGIRVKVAGIEVQPLECRHWSQIRMPDGTLASGVPMAFIIYPDEGVRFYHYGDTALFSDMKLQAELYRPNIGAIGVSNPVEILDRNPMPGEMLTGEMSPYEAALAAHWLRLETVLPCHYNNPDHDDVRDFVKAYEKAGDRTDAGRVAVLSPGDWIEVPPAGA